MSGGGAYQSVGADLIAAERQRQIDAEGWTPEHDREHTGDDLVLAAVCYAMPVRERIYSHPNSCLPGWWPWHERFWKPTPKDRVRELVKAGALIAAEIDRLTTRGDEAVRDGATPTCPACGFVLSQHHADEWWCERCPWDGCPLHPNQWACGCIGRRE